MSYAIQSKGATPNNSSTLSSINGFLNKNLGVPIPKTQPNQVPTSGMNSSNASMVPQGTNAGMLNKTPPKPDTTYTATTTTNGKGGVSTKPTPNKSVLEQQRSLNQANKNTPGYVPLVEDGLAGPKTQAAVEKYGFNTQTGQPNTPKTTPSTTPTSSNAGMVPETPKPTTYTPPDLGVNGISQGGLIGNAVGQSQTPNTNATIAAENLNALGLGGNNSPEVESAIKDLEELQKKYAGNTTNIAGTAGFLTQQGGTQALQNSQYATLLGAAQSRLANALAQQGQRINASSAAGGLGNTTQGLQQSALSTAISANQPQFPGYGSAQYNPSSNTYGTVGGGQYGSGPAAASNIQSVQQAQTGINTIDQSSTAVNNDFSAALNYAQSAGLSGSTGIIAGIQRKISEGVLTNSALVGFNQAIASLNSKLQALGEDPIDPNTATQQSIA